MFSSERTLLWGPDDPRIMRRHPRMTGNPFVLIYNPEPVKEDFL